MLTEGYSINADIRIDLNNHSLTGNLDESMFTVGANGILALGGGSIENKAQVIDVGNGGTVRILNGSYTSTTEEPFLVSPHGTLIVDDGEIIGSDAAIKCYGSDNQNGDNQGCYATVVINDGTLIGLDGPAISTGESAGMGHNSISIEGGHLEGNVQSVGYEAVGVYIANNDTFVLRDGDIIANGGTGICMRGGDVTISGGSITAINFDKNGNIISDGMIGGDPTIMKGCSAIIYHESANYPGKEGMQLMITGGNIIGIDHSIQVLSNEAEPKVFVTGGSITPIYPEPPEEEPGE